MGRRLVPYLLKAGYEVVSVDRAEIGDAAGDADQRIVDTRDHADLAAALRGCDALIHLAAYPSAMNHGDSVLYSDNTLSSYNALSAAHSAGIARICLASSANAIGGAFSRAPRYDYFPVDEHHPSYVEEAYSLSKWVMEAQADCFARRNPEMRIISLRLHWLMDTPELAFEMSAKNPGMAKRHLWSYTLFSEACRAFHLALTADFSGHETFFITAPRTVSPLTSLELAREHYPTTEIRGDLSGHASFYSCAKAEKLLGWRHEDSPPSNAAT